MVFCNLQYLLPRTLETDGEMSGQKGQDKGYWISKVGDVSEYKINQLFSIDC